MDTPRITLEETLNAARVTAELLDESDCIVNAGRHVPTVRATGGTGLWVIVICQGCTRRYSNRVFYLGSTT